MFFSVFPLTRNRGSPVTCGHIRRLQFIFFFSCELLVGLPREVRRTGWQQTAFVLWPFVPLGPTVSLAVHTLYSSNFCWGCQFFELTARHEGFNRLSGGSKRTFCWTFAPSHKSRWLCKYEASRNISFSSSCLLWIPMEQINGRFDRMNKQYLNKGEDGFEQIRSLVYRQTLA